MLRRFKGFYKCRSGGSVAPKANRRIKKTDSVDSGNTRLYYYNDKWQVLCEYNNAADLQNLYVYGNHVDEVLLIMPDRRFVVHDHLYSPVALVDYYGDVQERYEYDAYGEPTIWDADFTTERASSLYDNPYMFTGRMPVPRV